MGLTQSLDGGGLVVVGSVVVGLGSGLPVTVGVSPTSSEQAVTRTTRTRNGDCLISLKRWAGYPTLKVYTRQRGSGSEEGLRFRRCLQLWAVVPDRVDSL